MNRRSVILALALPLGALLVAACSQGDGGGQQPPPSRPPTELEVGSDTDATHDFTLRADETQVFTFSTAQPVGEFEDLVVIEVEWPGPDTDIRLDLTDGAGGETIATSIGPEYFWSPTGAEPAQAAQRLDTEAIRPGVPACRGPCVVIRPTGSPVHFEVTNIGEVAEPLSIYLYTDRFVDTNEPGNDNRATPFFYNFEEGGEGAIETLGDVDWWQVASLEAEVGTVELVHTGDLELTLFVDTGTDTLPHAPGQPALIEVGDLLRVESTGGLAARGPNSLYSLQPVPPAAPADEG